MYRAVYLTAFCGLAVLYYYLLGPPPTPSEYGDLPWWRPRGWAVRWEPLAGIAGLAQEEGPIRLLPCLLYGIPPALMMLLGVRLFRNVLLRIGVLGLGTALMAFGFYGMLAPLVWRFFSWTWPTLTLCMSLLLWALILAPSLVRATLKLPAAGRAVAVILAGLVIYLSSVEITGTGWPSLRLTPWPVIPVFGFLLLGYLIAAVHGAVGLGALVRSALAGPMAIAVGVLVAAVLSGTIPLGLFSEPTLRSGVFLAVLGAVGATALLLSNRDPREAASRGGHALAAGVMLILLIFLSDQAAIRDQETNRNHTAPIILDALERYYEQNDFYPDELANLVPDLVAEIPPPRVGIIRHPGEQFIYTNLGDSYVLEFACAKWVQCAYSPGFGGGWSGTDPNAADPNAGGPTGPDVAAAVEADPKGLGGAWTCDSKPPPLW